jgi:hypothetical protein
MDDKKETEGGRREGLGNGCIECGQYHENRLRCTYSLDAAKSYLTRGMNKSEYCVYLKLSFAVSI